MTGQNVKTNKSNVICTVLFLIYMIVTFLAVFHHEIWADEAQVWLLVKNLSLFDLFKHLVNEGHPSFFYLLMMPFAKADIPIFFMQIFCWFAMIIAVFLLLWKSPFNNFTKFSIMASAGFLYFFPIIARSYSILPFLIFLAAILYKKQKEHPILYACTLAIIANTHVIMFIFVSILGCYFLYDNFLKEKSYTNQNLCALSIISLGLLAVIIQLVGTEASNGLINYNFNEILKSVIRVFVQFFTNSIDYFSALLLSHQIMPQHPVLYFSLSIIFFILFIILISLQAFWDKRIFFLSIFSIGFQFAIYIFAYSSVIYPTRAFVAFLILLFGYWIILTEKNNKNFYFINKKNLQIILSLFFILTIFNGIHFAQKDFKYNYSSAQETSKFISQNIKKDSIIIPTTDAFGLAIYYYLPKYNFYSLHQKKNIKYMIWHEGEMFSTEEMNKIIHNELKNIEVKNKKIYILSSDFFNHTFENIFPKEYNLIFKSSPSLAIGETYKIYEYIGEIK